jgi:hypothetical protein
MKARRTHKKQAVFRLKNHSVVAAAALAGLPPRYEVDGV